MHKTLHTLERCNFKRGVSSFHKSVVKRRRRITCLAKDKGPDDCDPAFPCLSDYFSSESGPDRGNSRRCCERDFDRSPAVVLGHNFR